MSDVNAQLAHWEDLGEESRRLEVSEAGFAQAIEMAAEVAEEWFHSAEASDLDALLAAIKALKPPKD